MAMNAYTYAVVLLIWTCNVRADSSLRPSAETNLNVQQNQLLIPQQQQQQQQQPSSQNTESSQQVASSTATPTTRTTLAANSDDIISTTTFQELVDNNSQSDDKPCDCNNNSTSSGFFENFRNILESIVPTPIQGFLHLTLNTTQAARDQLRDRYNVFRQFLRQYNKNYKPQELQRRFAIFANRLKFIEQSTRDYQSGKSSFVMSVNKFIDWDDSELKILASLKVPQSAELDSTLDDASGFVSSSDSENEVAVESSEQFKGNTFTSILNMLPFFNFGNSFSSDNDELTGELKDWRQTGCMGPVIDQGNCGACYAFATLGVVDAMKCISSNGKPSPGLSVQELVDCSRSYGANNGCEGGWPKDVFNYLRDYPKVTAENCYIYKRRVGSCQRRSLIQQSSCSVPASIGSAPSGRHLTLKGERAMKNHVAQTGPLVAVMEVLNNFYYYKDGVYENPRCSKRASAVNHGLIIAGFGEENGKKYWLIKNTWDTNWGQNGYAKIRRGSNECSIESVAFGVPS